MTTRRTQAHSGPILIIGVIIVVGLAVFGLKRTPPAVVNPLPEEQKTESIEWPSAEVRKEYHQESTDRYQISIVYPVSKSAVISNYFKTFVDTSITEFKSNIEELPEGVELRKQVLDISYETTRSQKVETYVFTVAADTGGAHGVSMKRTFAFTKSGELLKVSTLFSNGLAGLTTLSSLTKAELKKQDFYDEKWVNEGAAPLEDNYKNFIVGDSDVTFIFDPYQVAAYAAGIPTVTIPANAFKKIANPNIFTIQ